MTDEKSDASVEPERFWIKDLTLENFRRFEKAEFGPFDPQFNLIIGENGAGKSSVLAALIQFYDPSDMIKKPRNKYLHSEDVRRASVVNYGNISNDRVFPSRISVTQNNRGHVERRFAKCGSQLSDVAVRSKHYSGFGLAPPPVPVTVDVTYPLSLLYGVERKFYRENGNSQIGVNINKNSRDEAYQNWDNAGEFGDSLLEWIAWQSHVRLFRNSQHKTKALDLLSPMRVAVAQCVERARDISFNPEIKDVVVTFDDDRVLEFSTMSDGQKASSGWSPTLPAAQSCSIRILAPKH